VQWQAAVQVHAHGARARSCHLYMARRWNRAKVVPPHASRRRYASVICRDMKECHACRFARQARQRVRRLLLMSSRYRASCLSAAMLLPPLPLPFASMP